MGSDTRLPAVILAVLVLALAIPLVVHLNREANRYRLVEVRLVSATSADPTFREGARTLTSDERVELAVALRIEQPGERPLWMSPAPNLDLDGTLIAHAANAEWPERDRFLRVFWFTIESSLLGGDIGPETVEDRLRHRTFIAPELGNGLTTSGPFESHADDEITLAEDVQSVAAGTLRFYARVEVVSRPSAVGALQTMSSLGLDHLDDPRLCTIHRQAQLPSPIDPRVGELFMLPGFETPSDPSPLPSWSRRFLELVEERWVTSTRSFAATALTGAPEIADADLSDHGRIHLDSDGSVRRHGVQLLWEKDVRTADLLIDSGRWLVLTSDDGDGVLDGDDLVLMCWRRPPLLLPLRSAVHAWAVDLELKRYRPLAG